MNIHACQNPSLGRNLHAYACLYMSYATPKSRIYSYIDKPHVFSKLAIAYGIFLLFSTDLFGGPPMFHLDFAYTHTHIAYTVYAGCRLYACMCVYIDLFTGVW